MTQIIKITYEADEIDVQKDARLITAMESIGLFWHDSGFDLTKNERDIRFVPSE